MLREVAEQVVHLLEIGAIDQVAAVTLLRDETGPLQFLQVERERGAGYFERFAHAARRFAFGARHDQRAKDAKAHGLGQCGKAFNGFCFFHISIIVEI